MTGPILSTPPKPRLRVGDKLQDGEGLIWEVRHINLRKIYALTCKHSHKVRVFRTFTLAGRFYNLASSNSDIVRHLGQ